MTSEPVNRGEALELIQGNVARYGLEAGIDESLTTGHGLRVIGRALGHHLMDLGIEFDAVGGRGRSALALSMATTAEIPEISGRGLSWFAIRPEPKRHGRQDMVDGARIRGQNVVVVDAISSTERLLAACEDVQAAGATLTGVVRLVELDPNGSQITDRYPTVVYSPLFKDEVTIG